MNPLSLVFIMLLYWLVVHERAFRRVSFLDLDDVYSLESSLVLQLADQLVKRNAHERLVVLLPDANLLFPVLVVSDYYCSDVVGNCLIDYVSRSLVEVVGYLVVSLQRKLSRPV